MYNDRNGNVTRATRACDPRNNVKRSPLWLTVRFVAGAIAAVVPIELARSQTENSYPMLMSLRPVAVQVGQSAECELSARYNVSGASRVFVSGSGVAGAVVPAETEEGDKPADGAAPKRKRNKSKISLRFTVAPDALPGPRDFRVLTPQGASTVGQLVVVRDPIVAETGDNNSPAKALAISLPATVCGAIESAEDVDCFKFQVDAGTSLVFRVWSMRLEDRIHDLQEHADPILTIRNAAGATVAACDNHYSADPLLHHRFEQAGEYVLEVRDVRYKGNADWVYAIEINSRPFVTQAMPLAVKPGADVHLSLVGHNLPQDAVTTVQIPADAPAGLRWLSPIVAGQPTNAVAVYVSPYAGVLKEPVNAPATPPADQPQTGSPVSTGPAPATGSPVSPVPSQQAITVPVVVSGRIDKPGDVDRFSFDAKAGEKLSFEVVARRAESALDSFMRILNPQGAAIAETDDMTFDRIQSQDSWLENWTTPADGKYTIELRDLHLRGGPQFTYALSVTRSQPYYTLEIDTDKTILAPGINSPIYVRVVRKNGFAGGVQLAVDGLPAGVTARCGRIPENSSDGCIILSAAPNAPAGAANIRIAGNASLPNPMPNAPTIELAAVARPLQEYYSPGGGRGNYPVEMHTVSVAEPMDIRSVKLSTNVLTLKPGESQRIEVAIERAPAFKGNVTLDVLYQHLEQPYGNTLPKGVIVDVGSSKTLLTGEETNGFITLKAAGDAPPVASQLVPLMAHVSINFVMKATYCEPVELSVVQPQ
jgi:hypothetical protein